MDTQSKNIKSAWGLGKLPTTSVLWLPLRRERRGLYINNMLLLKISQANTVKYYIYLSHINLTHTFSMLEVLKIKF